MCFNAYKIDTLIRFHKYENTQTLKDDFYILRVE